MLVAISGAQGTGKTTILNALSNNGYLIIERKTSRSVLFDWGYTLDQIYNDHQLAKNFQDEILRRKVEDEQQYFNNNQFIFTERSYADLFVYALIVLGKNNHYSEWLDDYYIRCRTYMQKYHTVFYLTSGHFYPKNDGVRRTNKHYQRLVDETLYRITQDMLLDISPTIIDTSDINKRIEQITNKIIDRRKDES